VRIGTFITIAGSAIAMARKKGIIGPPPHQQTRQDHQQKVVPQTDMSRYRGFIGEKSDEHALSSG